MEKHFILCDLDLGLQGHICDPNSLLPSRPHKKSLSQIILSDSFNTLAMSSCFIPAFPGGGSFYSVLCLVCLCARLFICAFPMGK